MVLDMTSILNGEVTVLNFDFSYVPEEDGELRTVLWDIEFIEPIAVKGFVKNMAGSMWLETTAKDK